MTCVKRKESYKFETKFSDSYADPESFVRGGPTLTKLSLLVVKVISGAIIGPPVKRHFNVVSLACR